MRSNVPSSLILGALALAGYWSALLARVDSPQLTHGGFLALNLVPVVLVLRNAVRHRERRLAWSALGAALLLHALGWLTLRPESTVPTPGLADAFWLAMYPFIALTLAALAWPWLRRSPARLALDAATVMLTAAALVTAVVLRQASENAGGLTGIAQLINFAYPFADSVLLSVALIGAAVAGWRTGPAWTVLAGGILALVVADVLWAQQAAAGTWLPVMDSNALYPLWTWLAAAASCIRGRPRVVTPGVVRTQAGALVATLVALGLLLANESTRSPRCRSCSRASPC